MHHLLLAVDTGEEVWRCGVSNNKLSTSSMYLMFNVDVTMVMVTMAVAGCPLLWLKDYVKIKLLIELETWKSENQVQREKSRGRGAQQQQYTARGYWGRGKTSLKSLRLRDLLTFGYFWLPLVTFGYFWLSLVIFGYLWLPLITFGYLWLLF